MAIITEFGLESESQGDWIRKYEEAYRTALGDDVATDASTAVGRMIREQANVGVKIDETVLYVNSGTNLYQAMGRQLTDYATLMGIPFNEGIRSTVTVTFTGTGGTLIPTGTRIQTSTGATFETTEDALIPNGGTSVDVLCRATVIGPIQAAASTLIQFVDVISGITSVINDEAADVGRNPETDAAWVNRYTNQVAVHGAGTLENVSARLLALPGIERAKVIHNPTAAAVTRKGFTQAANSFSVIVSGSATAAQIAEVIRDTATPGIPMNGMETYDLDGVTYRYTEAVETAIKIDIETDIVLGDFPADGRDIIRRNLVSFVEELTIGEDLDLDRLRAVLANVQGHSLQEFDVLLADDNPLTVTTEATLWTLASTDIDIELTTV